MIPQKKYVELLQEERVNHENFEGMNGGIKGQVIIDKHNEDFELLETLMTVKSDLPAIGHSPLIDLDFILKELFEMATPTDKQWRDIHRVRNHHPGRITSSRVSRSLLKICSELSFSLSELEIPRCRYFPF